MDRFKNIRRRDVLGLLVTGVASGHASSAERAKSRVTDSITVGDIPVLVSRSAEVQPGARLVLLYHGFGSPGSPKELADVLPVNGDHLVAAYVNLPLFAQRLPAGGTAELERLQSEDFVNGLFFRCIERTVQELPSVASELATRYHLDIESGVHLCGFSAGGSAVMLALIESEVTIASAASINAPMSVRQNVQVWERVMKRPFNWDARSEAAARRFDVVAHAREIADRRPSPAMLVVQSDADPLLQLSLTRAACTGINDSLRAEGSAHRVDLRIVPGEAHNFARGSRVSSEVEAWLATL